MNKNHPHQHAASESLEKKQIDIAALGPDYSAIILQCWMAHPANDDENKRGQLHALQWLKITQLQGADYPHALQSSLMDALDNGGAARFENSAWAGMMAGYALLIMLQMVDCNEQGAIRDKAVVVVSETLALTAPKKKKGFGHADSTVNAAWHKYKNVAHLWAAYLYLIHKRPADFEISAISIIGPHLAMIADALQTAGAYVLPNGGGPILPPSALSLQGFSKISLSEIGYEIADIASHMKGLQKPLRGKTRPR
ncbi:MAG: hypothetical protein GZ090_05065 [Oxalobacteraceae bacterium]|nr:hypothetical protein [Oxalobacteraceae bacterium]